MPPWKRRGRSERSRRPVSALPFRLPDTRASNSTCGTAASHLGGFVTAQLRPGTVWVAASDTICTCERRSRRIHRRRNWISMLIASFKPPGGLRRTPARCVASSLRGKTPARSATGSTGGEIPTATRTAKKKREVDRGEWPLACASVRACLPETSREFEPSKLGLLRQPSR